MISDLDETTPLSFKLGQVVATAAATETIPGDEMMTALDRHASCDWGDLCEEDKATNEQALRKRGRLFSAYETKDKTKFWIITEWDRSVTTILLPSDY
jgi:hypothetical protein